MAEPFHKEESERNVQFGAFWKFFDTLTIHSLDLNHQQFATFLHLAEYFLFLWFFYLDRAVILYASLDVLLNIADQKHVGIFIIFAVMYQLQYICEVGL